MLKLNKFFNSILEKCRITAESDREKARIRISAEYPETVTGVIFHPDDIIEIEAIGNKAEKAYITEELRVPAEEFKKMIKSDAWKFYEKLIKNQLPPDIKNATFIEKQAFIGFRKMIVDDLLNLPHEIVNIYEEITK